MSDRTCPECGAQLIGVSECREYLNEMIKWDFEDFAGVGKIHHLTVLSYNLQHPSVYSPERLGNAKRSLVEFMKDPESYRKHGMIDRENLGSDKRTWKIAGSAESHGVYSAKPDWSVRASDVVQGGLENYVDNVKKWSESVVVSLKEIGELSES